MKILAILGMHRSGTSLVAQACATSGVSAGPLEDLLSAQSDNPEGFYENRQLVELNDALLSAAEADWFRPSNLVAGARNTARNTARDTAELSGLLESLSSFSGGEFFLKDPRLCLTWDAWEPYAADATVLFVYRSPLAVARSLTKRNSFPLQLGLQLWEIYNRRALSLLAGREHLAVSYDELANGTTRLSTLIGQLKELGFHCNPGAADAVFSPKLRHFADVTDDPDAELLSDSQRNLDAHCQAVCRGQTAELPTLDPESLVLARIRDTATALEPLARTVETANERDEAQVLASERTAERDKTLQAFEVLEGDHKSLAAAHQEEKRLHKNAADTLDYLRGQHASLESEHKHLNELHDELHDDHAQLQGQYATLQEKADYLFFALTESLGMLLTFEQSTMARLQGYLRSVYRLLTRQRGRNSAYEDLLERAHAHYSEFEIEVPRAPPSKLRMAGDVLRYVWNNPAGSARSFSWSRLKKAVSVFFGSSSDELAVWVNARFPDRAGSALVFDPGTLSADLDTLELDFPESERPLVSIIIPVFNDYRVTINCLKSLHRFTGSVDYELIVADDCSTDLTASISDRMRGITVARTDQNLRFLRNCNQAAEHARGQYLLFLNNDTAVTDGWLEALLEPFEDSAVGVTGPKLLFADGSLQEAGGIIWRDASGWNYGRADNPDKPAFNYLRDVDYVSGAALMIRTDLWTELGGFDERFAPAYYEDADICFAARAAGYRVVYQPRSVVYHFEGVSNGTDLSSGVKQHQVVNQGVFRDKWQAELDARHFENAQHVIHARDRSADKPCVLFIDHYVPHFDKDAGGRSTFMYVELLLSLGCRVQFMGANFFPHQPYTQTLQAMGVEVLVSESVARHLDSWLAEHAPYIDEIFLHRPHVAEQFLPHLEKLTDCPTISFFGHDLHYLRFEREAALKDDDGLRREAKQWRKRELAVCERVDRVYYFSQAELDELQGSVEHARLRRIPLYAMPMAALSPYQPAEPQSLLFVGGYNHPPNVDAASWLAEAILPRLLETAPGVKLHLVGSNPSPAVLALAGEHVMVHGYLTDDELDALYRDIGVAVVPLRYGAGVKGKVIEAIRQNVPIVTTDIGAEGIPEADSVMWIGNTAEEISAHLLSIIEGRASVGQRMSLYADWLTAHFSREEAAAQLATDRPWLRSAKTG